MADRQTVWLSSLLPDDCLTARLAYLILPYSLVFVCTYLLERVEDEEAKSSERVEGGWIKGPKEEGTPPVRESIKSSEKGYSFNQFNFKNLKCTVEASPTQLAFVLTLQRTATQIERALCTGLFKAMKSLTVLHGDWAAY